MRYTLEQLKAMSEKELVHVWGCEGGNGFPFDMADCGHCLTLHSLSEVRCHPQITKALKQMEPGGSEPWWFHNLGRTIKKHLEELYALRLFYDHLYPQPNVAEAEKQLETMREDWYDHSAGTR